MDITTQKVIAGLIKALLHSKGLDPNEAATMMNEFETEVKDLRNQGYQVEANELDALVQAIETILKEF